MGYNTKFTGELKFTTPVTTEQLAKLNTFFGEDARDHDEWGAGKNGNYGYIDLVLSKDFTGIKWDDGTEKTYYLENSVNIIIEQMRKQWPEFGLTGKLLAQGEDFEDRWELAIGEDGKAVKRDITIEGARMVCPRCSHKFIVEA